MTDQMTGTRQRSLPPRPQDTLRIGLGVVWG
jgi:hypothetical protein